MSVLVRSFVVMLGLVGLVGLAACAHRPGPGVMFRDCAACPEMVVVPAGTLVVGANFEGLASYARRRIDFADDFAVGRFEVTVEQYEAFIRATERPASEHGYCQHALDSNLPWQFEQSGDHPVVCVSWEDAQAYVQWLNSHTPGGYRLLSLTEWEYAARAGTVSQYPWGDTASHEHANYGADECCSGLASGRDQWVHTAPVGSFGANAFGLSDMIGNVWEWTQECAGGDFYLSLASDGSARDGTHCTWGRWARGGSWESDPASLTFHFEGGPGFGASNNLGFRLARTLPVNSVPRLWREFSEGGQDFLDQGLADARCPVVAYAVRGRWNGQWDNDVERGRTMCRVVGARRPGPLAAPADIEAGPIRDEADAEEKCEIVAAALQARWTGQWRTTRRGRMSVCGMAPH